MDGRLVPPNELDAIWPAIKNMVADACTHSNGRYLAHHIYALARHGEWQIWVVHEGESVRFVGGTHIVYYPTGLKALSWRFGTGDGREQWQHFMDLVLQWARLNGCTLAEGVFRRGWRRALTGWDHTHEFLERAL